MELEGKDMKKWREGTEKNLGKEIERKRMERRDGGKHIIHEGEGRS
jgi:hypothetical protein